MQSTSFEFRQKVSQNTGVLLKATLTLANGTKRELVGDDFMGGTAKWASSTSSDGKFDIGACIIGQFSVTLNNYDRRFDDYDFTGSKIEPYVGIELDSGSVEWLKKGVYWVDQPESYGSTIGITALDNLSKLEVPFSDAVRGMPLLGSEFGYETPRFFQSLEDVAYYMSNNTHVRIDVPAEEGRMDIDGPMDEEMSALQALSYALQTVCLFAVCDEHGTIKCRWYDTSIYENEDWLDGQIFDDGEIVSGPPGDDGYIMGDSGVRYASGSKADGGDFIDYSSGYAADGGSFGRREWVNVFAYSSATVCTDDVVITGVQVQTADYPGNVQLGEDPVEGRLITMGKEGYVLALLDNPFITQLPDTTAIGDEDSYHPVAQRILSKVGGMRFRPLTTQALGDPAVEAGDGLVFTDHLNNQYVSWVTSLEYCINNYATYTCSAETPSRNSASGFSSVTEAIVKIRNQAREEKTTRERAIEELQKKLGESAGLFTTSTGNSAQGYVYYLHDKPTLAESKVVWKMNANGIAISTEGDSPTAYKIGMDVDGNAILKRIYAIGLDADYIRTGTLTIAKDRGTSKERVMLSANADTGDVYVDAASVMFKTSSLNEKLSGTCAYGTCTTAAATVEKTVVCEDFVLFRGATIVVRFTYGNAADGAKLNVNGTGAKYIATRENTQTKADHPTWGAYDAVQFVYNGTAWMVADSGARTEIKQLADSISLSVTNGALGKTASIVLSANGQSTTRSIDMSNVREAFKNDTTSVTITAGRITFNSGTFVVNSTYFSVTSTGVITATSGTIGGFTISATSISNDAVRLNGDGIALRRDGVNVGNIGSNYWVHDATKKGLVFDLESNGAYMCWGHKKSSTAGEYTACLMYTAKSMSGSNDITFASDTLHFLTKMDAHGYVASNFYINPDNGGASGGVNVTSSTFILITQINSTTGAAQKWTSGCKLQFKNGFLVSCVLPK